MDHAEHARRLGELWGNLHSLEMMLRQFLATSARHDAPVSLHGLRPGQRIAATAWTRSKSLAQLLTAYNAQAKLGRQISSAIVQLRDTLAHGLVYTDGPAYPLTIVKLSNAPSGDGSYVVETVDVMDEPWFTKNKHMVVAALETVADAARDASRG